MKERSNEILIVRNYNAPLEAVWCAWTETSQVEKWWGPRGFTLTTHAKELRVGGFWHYTMHGPDGTDYPNKTIYHKVENFSELVYDHGGNDDKKPMFKVTANFSKLAHNKTLLEMIMAFPTPEQAKESQKFIKIAGGDATWDRLAEYLAKTLENKDIFVVNRRFEVPIKTLQKEWNTVSQPQFKINCSNNISFVEEGEGRSRIVVCSEVLLREIVSVGEIKSFEQEKATMTKVWNQVFDRLEEEKFS
jgi:uncharacterized protein YndB with AHSA1/START domain